MIAGQGCLGIAAVIYGVLIVKDLRAKKVL
jgi:hypothetical protein